MQNMDTMKKLPIGIEDFEEIRSEGFYYVDKTGLIRDLIYNWGKVNLFTRPRRFGKSLNMSMLKYFFESGCDRTLFAGLEIARDKELCDEYLGKFPVISISLKSVCAENFQTARGMLCSVIGNEALRFQNLLASAQLTRYDLQQYEALLNVDSQGRFTMSDEALMNSLFILSRLLKKYSNQKVIILIDEYDVPLDKAQQYGFYDQMVNLIRNMFNQSLKSNDSLYFAVLTGCLRVSKESIFTGLNNPQVFSISDTLFDKYFGFTDREVQELLSCCGLSEHYDTVKEWYDGYQFGNTDMYCPWDVLNYCRDLRADSNAQPQDYWSNTSGNDIVKCFIRKAGKTTTRREIEQLIAGEVIRKPVRQELTYKELYDSIDNLWSVLYTTGYLTKGGSPEGKIFPLKIPNLEIRQIFTNQIYSWFQENKSKS